MFGKSGGAVGATLLALFAGCSASGSTDVGAGGPESFPPLEVTTATLPDGEVGVTYEQTLSSTGGAGANRWSVRSGDLPGGLSLETSSGRLFGTPNLAGTFAFAVQVTSGDGQTASRSLEITVEARLTTLTNECASPGTGWIWCDDFDTDRFSSYFERGQPSRFSRVDGVGVDGSWGMRASFLTGVEDSGSLKVAFGRTPDAYFDPVDAGTADYREIYWRVYVKNQAGWTGGGGEKLTRATIFAASSWAQAMIAHVWSGGNGENYLALDPASGTDAAGNLVTTRYNDFANLRWLGIQFGTTPIFASDQVGRWRCIETRVKLNDAGSSNGAFQLWIDGALEASTTSLNWVGSYGAYGINAVFLENLWNDGAPTNQERYFDNFVVSTQPIGCGG